MHNWYSIYYYLSQIKSTFHQKMQTAEEGENNRPIDKNTYSTDSSKRDDIDPDDNFKLERKKYLQERLNRRQQVKKIKKQNHGSSSSESEEEV